MTGVGVVVNVSDMSPSKKGTDYFHATLHDGVEQTRRQRDFLKEFEENGETVDISACKTKRANSQKTLMYNWQQTQHLQHHLKNYLSIAINFPQTVMFSFVI